jgi:hypothetical protein
LHSKTDPEENDPVGKEEGSMKKGILFMMCLLMLNSTSFAGRAKYALDKGSVMLGVSGGYLSAKGELYEDQDGEGFSAFLISHQLAYFALPRLGVGGDLFILRTSQGPLRTTTTGWGPRIMGFLWGQDRKAHPFLIAGFYLVKSEMEYGDIGGLKYSGTRFKLGAGSAVMLNHSLSLVMEVSYNLDDLELTGADEDRLDGKMWIFTMGLAGFLY